MYFTFKKREIENVQKERAVTLFIVVGCAGVWNFVDEMHKNIST